MTIYDKLAAMGFVPAKDKGKAVDDLQGKLVDAEKVRFGNSINAAERYALGRFLARGGPIESEFLHWKNYIPINSAKIDGPERTKHCYSIALVSGTPFAIRIDQGKDKLHTLQLCRYDVDGQDKVTFRKATISTQVEGHFMLDREKFVEFINTSLSKHIEKLVNTYDETHSN